MAVGRERATFMGEPDLWHLECRGCFIVIRLPAWCFEERPGYLHIVRPELIGDHHLVGTSCHCRPVVDRTQGSAFNVYLVIHFDRLVPN